MDDPIDLWQPELRAFADEHTWAVLATGRRDGSPQQSMVGYLVLDDGRIVISAKSYTAKWHNARRQPKVSLLIPDDRKQLVVTGEAEGIDTEPRRSELTELLFRSMLGTEPTDPAEMIPMLDEQRRVVLLVTPDHLTFHP
jgi:PPOX class probable F420-dependent enzyme